MQLHISFVFNAAIESLKKEMEVTGSNNPQELSVRSLFRFPLSIIILIGNTTKFATHHPPLNSRSHFSLFNFSDPIRANTI